MSGEGTPAPDQFSAKFTDNPALKFTDVSCEQSRSYEFPGGVVITVHDPVAVCATVSGAVPKVGALHSHRVVDASGAVNYIPPGWVLLKWVPKPGTKAVAF